MNEYLRAEINFLFSLFYSQFGSQSHTHFNNYLLLLALDSPPTPRPGRPLLGSSDPERHTPSSSRILSPVNHDSRHPSCPTAESPPPPPSEWRASYAAPSEPVELGLRQGRDSKPEPRCVNDGEPKLQPQGSPPTPPRLSSHSFSVADFGHVLHNSQARFAFIACYQGETPSGGRWQVGGG